MKLETKPALLRALAVRRLAQRHRADAEASCAEVERLRSEGWIVIGGPRGCVLLPVEKD